MVKLTVKALIVTNAPIVSMVDVKNVLLIGIYKIQHVYKVAK